MKLKSYWLREPVRNNSFAGVDYTRLGVEKNQSLLTDFKLLKSSGNSTQNIRSVKNMEILVKPHRIVQDGLHEGAIVGVEYREKPFPYTDYVIEFEDGLNIKASYPTNLTPETVHGKMLKRFGVAVIENQTVNPEKLMIGQKCIFVTVNEVTDKGTFPRVISESLKPAPIVNPNAGLNKPNAPAGFVPAQQNIPVKQ